MNNIQPAAMMPMSRSSVLKRICSRGISLALFGLVVLHAPAYSDDDFAAQRARLVREITSDVIDTRHYIGKKTLDTQVMSAMRSVERHQFVPAALQDEAYENRPLPIGYGQTISQPYIVALMTDLLDPDKSDVVLEIGTGSGYQAAILARVVSEVYSIEIIPQLGEAAAERLERLGFDNIELRTGDGYYGWEEHAPFDAIIVTAAASHIPPPLVGQLKRGGVLMIPVGPPFQVQQLTLVRKNLLGQITTRQIMPVSFVPFTGGQ